MSSFTHKSLFEIPELAELVHPQLKPRDGAALARTNRSLFQMIMPQLWERVGDVSQVLNLIPAWQLVVSVEDPRPRKELAQALNRADFTRFDLYAPWITHLELCGDGENTLKQKQLDAIRHISAKLLLPNLVSITCTDHQANTDSQLILPFLSPSLLSLEFVVVDFDEIPHISIPEMSIMLHLLSQKCPNLRTLAVYAKRGHRSRADDYALKFVSDYNTPSVEDLLQSPAAHIRSIRPLVNLACSDEIITVKSFEIISRWPLLESLEINMSNTEGNYLLPTLPDTAFPSLKHFGLYWFTDMAFELFWNIPALVSNLTSIKLLPSTGRESPTSLLPNLLSYVANKSPKLQRLWFQAANYKSIRGIYKVAVPTLQNLRQLPLQAIRVEGMVFVAQDNTSSETGYNESLALKATFPGLKELAFPRSPIYLMKLPTLALEIPYLEVVCVSFDSVFNKPSPQVELSQVARRRNPLLRIVEADWFRISNWPREAGIPVFNYEHAVLVAEILFSIWPNVQIVAAKDEKRPTEYKTQKRRLALINDHLAALFSCNQDLSMRYEDVKVLNNQTWSQCRYVVPPPPQLPRFSVKARDFAPIKP